MPRFRITGRFSPQPRPPLACEQASYAAQELKYQQGSISENTLLSARDTLQEAEETVESAKNDLFSAYNSYCWAVEHGT